MKMLRTKSGLDRHGKRRVRFRKAGVITYLKGILWSEDFMRQYAAAPERLKAQTTSISSRMPLPTPSML
jgi:hypothetical protein